MSQNTPISEKTDLVSTSILINGTAISDVYQVISIVIEKEINRIPYARIEILDGDPSSEDFVISSGKDFIPGNEITIKAGYHSENELIFGGIIIKHGIKIRKGKASILMVECRDKAIAMTVGRKSASYSADDNFDTESAIFKKIINNYSGLEPDVPESSPAVKEVLQYYSTDWDFMVSRADVNGYVVLVDNSKVSIKSPDTSTDPVLTVSYGDTILSFESEIDARTQLTSVQCNSWNFKSQDIINVKSKSPTLTTPGNMKRTDLASVAGSSVFQLHSTVPIEENNLQSWADAMMTKSVLAKVSGTLSCQGDSSINPGEMITISGVGKRFNGNIYVSGVIHTLQKGNWISKITFGNTSKWFAESEENIMSAPAAGLLPGIQGLQNGVVMNIVEEKDSEFRVQVKVPVISKTEGIWARLVNLYATANAGTFFYPEIGDEVLVGFLNDDPSFPVVLGSFYSTAKTPPYKPDDKNTYKAIITKNKLKIIFDDDKMITTILTPKNNSIVLSDNDTSITITDSNKNSIKLSSEGIVLDSKSGIKINAAEDITISATKDIKISGNNVNANANLQAIIKGTTAQLTATAEATVKGATVMIN